MIFSLVCFWMVVCTFSSSQRLVLNIITSFTFNEKNVLLGGASNLFPPYFQYIPLDGINFAYTNRSVLIKDGELKGLGVTSFVNNEFINQYNGIFPMLGFDLDLSHGFSLYYVFSLRTLKNLYGRLNLFHSGHINLVYERQTGGSCSYGLFGIEVGLHSTVWYIDLPSFYYQNRSMRNIFESSEILFKPIHLFAIYKNNTVRFCFKVDTLINFYCSNGITHEKLITVGVYMGSDQPPHDSKLLDVYHFSLFRGNISDSDARIIVDTGFLLKEIPIIKPVSTDENELEV